MVESLPAAAPVLSAPLFLADNSTSLSRGAQLPPQHKLPVPKPENTPVETINTTLPKSTNKIPITHHFKNARQMAEQEKITHNIELATQWCGAQPFWVNGRPYQKEELSFYFFQIDSN